MESEHFHKWTTLGAVLKKFCCHCLEAPLSCELLKVQVKFYLSDHFNNDFYSQYVKWLKLLKLSATISYWSAVPETPVPHQLDAKSETTQHTMSFVMLMPVFAGSEHWGCGLGQWAPVQDFTTKHTLEREDTTRVYYFHTVSNHVTGASSSSSPLSHFLTFFLLAVCDTVSSAPWFCSAVLGSSAVW